MKFELEAKVKFSIKDEALKGLDNFELLLENEEIEIDAATMNLICVDDLTIILHNEDILDKIQKIVQETKGEES